MRAPFFVALFAIAAAASSACATAGDPDLTMTGDGGHRDAFNGGGDGSLDDSGRDGHSLFDADDPDVSAHDSKVADIGVSPDTTPPPPDTTPVDTSTCVPGPCASGDPCKTASIVCPSGACSITGSAPDGTSCGTKMSCSGGTCVCSPGLTKCGGACVDLSSDPTNCGACGKSCPSGSCTAGSCVVAASPVTVDFPNSSDPYFTSAGSYCFWTVGDYVQGSRTTSLASTTSASISVAISPDYLAGDTQDMKMSINGIDVGTFSISSSSTTVTASFSYASIAGPTYMLRFETTRTVISGDGCAGFAASGSSVTLNP